MNIIERLRERKNAFLINKEDLERDGWDIYLSEDADTSKFPKAEVWLSLYKPTLCYIIGVSYNDDKYSGNVDVWLVDINDITSEVQVYNRYDMGDEWEKPVSEVLENGQYFDIYELQDL